MIDAIDIAVFPPIHPTHSGSSTKPMVGASVPTAGLDATPEPDSAASDDCPQCTSSDASRLRITDPLSQEGM